MREVVFTCFSTIQAWRVRESAKPGPEPPWLSSGVRGLLPVLTFIGCPSSPLWVTVGCPKSKNGAKFTTRCWCGRCAWCPDRQPATSSCRFSSWARLTPLRHPTPRHKGSPAFPRASCRDSARNGNGKIFSRHNNNHNTP